jgi:hypothetical protein
MSLEANERPKPREINSTTLVQILKELNATELDSWQENNFTYTFLRLGNRINVESHYFLQAENLNTKEVLAIETPSSIRSGREALSWVTSTLLK